MWSRSFCFCFSPVLSGKDECVQLHWGLSVSLWKCSLYIYSQSECLYSWKIKWQWERVLLFKQTCHRTCEHCTSAGNLTCVHIDLVMISFIYFLCFGNIANDKLFITQSRVLTPPVFSFKCTVNICTCLSLITSQRGNHVECCSS